MRWIRACQRILLRLWFRTGRKPGWHYRYVEARGAGLAGREPLVSRLPDGSRVECDLREQIPRLIYFQGVYEPPEAYLFTQLVQPGWTVIDCGANIGQYTLLAASRIGAGGAVHCFEPVPSTAAQLRRNLAANGPTAVVRVNEAALWHEPAQLQLGLATANEFVSGGFSVGVRAEREALARQIEAPGIVFDAYAVSQRLERVDLIKMDIEGAEYFALQGMRATLRRHRPLIQMEICRSYGERLGYLPGDIWKLLVEEMGYQAWAIGSAADESHTLVSLEGIDQQNVIFHAKPLPAPVLRGWDRRSLLRWSRQGWR